MNFDVKYLDVTPYLVAKKQPVAMVERHLPPGYASGAGVVSGAEAGRLGSYWVPVGPVLPGMPIEWSLTETGQYVRVPVGAYRTQERALATLLGLAVQIGMVAIDSLRQYTGDRPSSVTLVLGHECPQTPDGSAFQCFVGVAVRTR